MKDITVTFSVYGTFDTDRLRATIKSVQEQEDCNVQIVVSEQNLEPKLEKLSKNMDFKHVYSIPLIEEGKPVYNPGGIRNKAVRILDTEFVYLNDADIVFQNPRYLVTLLDELWQEVPLIRPPSRRLVKADVPIFIEMVDQAGIHQAIKALKHPNEYVANLDGSPVELKVVNHRDGRTYTTDMEMFIKYKHDPSLKGLEPTFWFDIMHVGGIFALAEQVHAVGGYTSSYLTWGHEDSDLQWKLEMMYGIMQIPRKKEFEILHLDHDKGYFCPEQNISNKQIFAKRKELGIGTAIAVDLEGMLHYG